MARVAGRALASTRALGLLLGFTADRILGDPRHHHPVAGFGVAATTLEQRMYADSRIRGAGYAALLVGGVLALGVAGERSSTAPVGRVLLTAAATWVVLGGRSLEREALAVLGHLDANDLGAAREQLTHLVGRDTRALGGSEISRAVIESLAENTSDAVVAPLVWGAVAGVPGLLGHRAANTLDAMVGHHDTRYERFGWASARLDDVVNLPGSRLAGAATLLASPRTARAGARAWRLDAAAHPSPNAGVAEATFAGVLGVRLGGTNRYAGDRIEHRAVMGDGREPEGGDIPRANRLARRVGTISVVVAAAVATAVTRRA